nr:MAG TPA: hypothetical protein [Caudoviricetes sp.]
MKYIIKSLFHKSSLLLFGVYWANAVKQFELKAMGQLQVLLPVTPCRK